MATTAPPLASGPAAVEPAGGWHPTPATVSTARSTIVGFGDPVLDIVARVGYTTLQQLGLEAGGCVAVELEAMQRLTSLSEESNEGSPQKLPGGSAANVCKCLAGLQDGGNVRFVGMVGRDEAAREYAAKMEAAGVHAVLPEAASDAATASCLCLVTPDGQRTMRTHLGAALELDCAEALPPGWNAGDLALLHCEGYCLYRPGAARAAMQAARAAGAAVSLDLASFEVVQHCWGTLLQLLQEGQVDLLFCNQDEAAAAARAAGIDPPGPTPARDTATAAVSGEGDSCPEGPAVSGLIEAVQQYFLQYVHLVVVSLGSDGCCAATKDGGRAAAPAPAVNVVDTVGAGDFFTAGVLHAWLQQAPLQACAQCGCAAGAAAIQAAGGCMDDLSMQLLKERVGSIIAASGGQPGAVLHR